MPGTCFRYTRISKLLGPHARQGRQGGEKGMGNMYGYMRQEARVHLQAREGWIEVGAHLAGEKGLDKSQVRAEGRHG